MRWTPLLLRLVPGCVMLAAIGLVTVISWHRPPAVTPRQPQPAPVEVVTSVPPPISGGESAGTLPVREAPEAAAVWSDRDAEPDLDEPPILVPAPAATLELPVLVDPTPDRIDGRDELRPQHARPRPKPKRVTIKPPPPPPPPPRDAAVPVGPRWPTLLVRIKPDEAETWVDRGFRGN